MEVWHAFNKLMLPDSSKEFIRESLWAKLKLGDRLKSWLPRQHHCCPCGEVETVPHALFHCNFLLLAGDTLTKCPNTFVHQILPDHLQTLSTPPALLFRVASQANWSVQSCVRFSNRSVNMGCAVLGRRAEPPQFFGLLIWLEPGLSHVHWCTMMQQCALHVSFARYCLFCTFCDLVFLCSN